MIENLLYPKKLTEAPQLLVDVETLFEKDGNMNTSLVGFASKSSMNKDVNYRLISVGEDGRDTFRVGFIADVTNIRRSDYVNTALAVPFQSLETEIVSVKCHGWSTGTASIMSTPNKTVEKTSASMMNSPEVISTVINPPDGHEYLLKMESPEFEGNGSSPRFTSIGSGYGIYCNYRNSKGNLGSEFPEIFNNYSTVALEVIVKVKVHYSNFKYGFMVGIVQL